MKKEKNAISSRYFILAQIQIDQFETIEKMHFTSLS